MNSRILGLLLIIFGVVLILIDLIFFIDTIYNFNLFPAVPYEDLTSYYLSLTQFGVTALFALIFGIIIKRNS